MFNRIKKRCFQRLPIAYYPYKRFMHQYKCIFIHIPKNAGSSVLKLFDDNGGRKHAKWFDFFEANDYFFKQYYKFAIVREPLERLYSAYNYSILGGNQSITDLALKDEINQSSDSFDSFIEAVLTHDFVMIQPLFQPQYLYIFDRQLNSQVNCILRYESLASEWERVANDKSLPTQLPWINRNTTKKKYSPISKKSIDKINKIYRLDYQLLNYPLPSSTNSSDTQ